MFEINEILRATGGRLIFGDRNASIKGISIDSRTIRPKEAFIAIKGANFDGHNFIDEAIRKRASCVIREPDMRYLPVSALPAGRRQAGATCDMPDTIVIEVKDTIRALGDIARFHRLKFDIPVIAVAGSNGKTTTKEMIAWVLSRKFKVLKNEGTKNNQIGLPLTLFNLNRSYDFVVLELGTNHPGEIEYLAKIAQPNIGIITNIDPAHLEYFKNLRGVFKEKTALLSYLKEPAIAILNTDDGLLERQIIRKIKRPFILGFGIKNKSDFYASDIKMLNGKIEFLVNPHTNYNKDYAKYTIGVGVNQKYRFTPLDRRSRIDDAHRHLTGFTLKTLGYYNIYNALIATAVARLFSMQYKDIALKLANFNFPQSRLILKKLHNIKFIDDTYNANPVSLKQALDALDNFHTKGRKIFVMGDMLELGSQAKSFHRQAGKMVAGICDAFITVGQLSRLAAQAAQASGLNIKNIFTCENSTKAKGILFNRISPKEDDVILIKGSRAMKMEEILK